MSTNMELIEAKTLTTTTASFTFSAIPATYTDLCIVVSARSDTSSTQDGLWISQINGSGSNLSNIWLRGSGSGTTSSTSALYGILVGQINAANSTASTFSNLSIYIPNYASANNKSISIDSVQEHNATEAYMGFTAGLWSNSAAITSITLDPQVGDLVQHSTAYLYGISNVTSTAKATGGIVSSDGTYWYHMFPFSGTFTPTTSLTADYLVVAGGGGGGCDNAGGGGAGGLRSTVTATGGGGSLETALSLTAQAYTVTVGAGGAGAATSASRGTAGGNSVFSTITSTGGGGGGSDASAGVRAGGDGGSSGGGNGNSSSAAGTRTASPVQGFNGGSGFTGTSSVVVGGGGGGAGAVGANGLQGGAGNGGVGVQITAFANATQTGVNSGYYAGGGGGGSQNTTFGVGGLGGGGAGKSVGGQVGGAGTVNLGAGGGGSATTGAGAGGAGGSGLVIIRYAI